MHLTKSKTFKYKKSQQMRNRCELPQSDKGLYKTKPNSTAKIIFNGWKNKCFPHKIRNKTKMFTFTISINIILEYPAKTMRQEKEMKGVLIEK